MPGAVREPPCQPNHPHPDHSREGKRFSGRNVHPEGPRNGKRKRYAPERIAREVIMQTSREGRGDCWFGRIPVVRAPLGTHLRRYDGSFVLALRSCAEMLCKACKTVRD